MHKVISNRHGFVRIPHPAPASGLATEAVSLANMGELHSYLL